MSNILTQQSLLAVITRVEPLRRHNLTRVSDENLKVIACLLMQFSHILLSRLIDIYCVGDGIGIISYLCTESHSWLIQILGKNWESQNYQSYLELTNCRASSRHHTLQISSPWKPPAAITLSFTTMVLISTLDSDWADESGCFCKW